MVRIQSEPMAFSVGCELIRFVFFWAIGITEPPGPIDNTELLCKAHHKLLFYFDDTLGASDNEYYVIVNANTLKALKSWYERLIHLYGIICT